MELNLLKIVINGLTLDAIKTAMSAGIRGAINNLGVMKITAANYGGKLGPYRADLKELVE